MSKSEHGDMVDFISDAMQHTKSIDFADFAQILLDLKETPLSMSFLNIGHDNIQMAFRMMYHAWRMRACGERIYYIPQHLCDMLLHTDLTLDSSFIQSPFEEIYVYTDQSDLTMTDYTGTRPVKGLYLNLKYESDGIKKLRFLSTSGAGGIDESKDINHFACFKIPEHGSLDDIINRQFDEYNQEPQRVGEGIELEKIAEIMRFSVNILLYITSANADLTKVQPKRHDHKSPKKQKKYSNKAQFPFIYVGHNVALPKGSESFKAGTSITYKFWVSGHWRAQWKGSIKENKRYQERIWIQPYIKGPDLVDGLAKKYIVPDIQEENTTKGT